MLFIELVPRDINHILDQAKWVLSTYPQVSGINVPDIKRLDHRSHDVVALLLEAGVNSLPHVRAIDRPISETIATLEPLLDRGLKSVLLVSGDPPADKDTPVYDVAITDLISKIKSKWPDLTVYAAVDQYRQSQEAEFAYMNQKLEAGADGFFTQPFFDVDLARTYCEAYPHTQLYLGSSPVTTENSKTYWETVNKVSFSPEFSLSLNANAALAKGIYELATSFNQHSYAMPIRIDLESYLSEFLGGRVHA